MKLYKLTDGEYFTHNYTKWGENVTHAAKAGIPILCTKRVIHAYRSPLLAVLMNPVHANIKNPLLWEAEGEVVIDDGTKVGCKSLTTLRIIDPPFVTNQIRAAFAILAAKFVYKEEVWTSWANAWLDNTNRTTAAASNTADAYYTGNAAAAAYAAAKAAAYAADAPYAAYAVANAAYAVANAADIDLCAIAEQAMVIEHAPL